MSPVAPRCLPIEFDSVLDLSILTGGNLLNISLDDHIIGNDHNAVGGISSRANVASKLVIAASSSVEVTSEQPKYSIKSLTSKELTPALIDKMVKFFRLTFNGESFGEFVVCQGCRIQRSIRDFPEVYVDGKIILEKADQIELPLCPNSDPQKPHKMEFFHHPVATLEKTTDKLSKNAYVTLMTDQSGEITGMHFGYRDTARNIFEKEWKYEYAYTQSRREDRVRDIKLFEEFLSQYGLTLDSEIFCWSCSVMAPEVRGQGQFPRMLVHFISSLAAECKDLISFGETTTDSEFARLMFKFAPSPITKVQSTMLGRNLILMMAPLQNAIHVSFVTAFVL